MTGGIARHLEGFALAQNIFVFAVEGSAPARLAQNGGNTGIVLYEQGTGGRSHENLDACGPRQTLQLTQIADVFMRAAHPKCKIAVHAVGAALTLVRQGFRAGGERVGVGHFKHGGHTAQDSGARTAFQIFLVRGTRLTKMHLRIDDARQNMQAGAIDDLPGAGAGQITDMGDGLSDYANVTRSDAVLVDQRAALQNHIVGLCHRRGLSVRVKLLIPCHSARRPERRNFTLETEPNDIILRTTNFLAQGSLYMTSVYLENRGWLKVTGGDAPRFLQDMLTNDVLTLSPGQMRYAALLS